MIAPLHPQQTDATFDSRPITIHLHIPREMTAAFMQLVTAITAQRSLFQEDFVARSVSDRESEPRLSPTGRKGHGEQSVRPAATPEAEASNSAEVEALPTGPQAASPEPATESLLDLYRRLLKDKRLRRASPDTVGDHQTGFRLFDEYFAETQASGKTLHRSQEPVQSLSDPETIRSFVDWLITTRENSAFTINRRLIALKMLASHLKLDYERPSKSEIDRRIRELRPNGRSVAKQSKREKLSSKEDGTSLPNRKIPSFAEIDAMARAVDTLRWPYGDHAPYFWRGWLRTLAFIGPRSRDIISTVSRKPGLRKADVIWTPGCPITDVDSALGRPLLSPHGWLWYSIEKDHHSDCRKILIPMPKWMRDWVRFFFELSDHPERVFPSTQAGRKSLSQPSKTKAWDKLISLSGVDPRIVESEGKEHSIAIRKYAANWWKLAVQKLQNRDTDTDLAKQTAWYILHHAEVTVSDKHYLSTQASVLPVMLELMDRWPIPAADAPPVSMLPE
jgi:hypothetical protein